MNLSIQQGNEPSVTFAVQPLLLLMLMTAVMAAAPGSARAMENGVSSFPIGAFDFGAGFLPPPGDSVVVRFNHYRTKTLKDNNGNKVTGFAVAPGVTLPADVNVRVDSGALTYLRVTEHKIGSANYAFGGTLPVTFRNTVKTVAGSAPSRAQGAPGDVVIDPFILTWHHKNLHHALGTHIIIPVGSYDPSQQAQYTRDAYGFQIDAPFTYISDKGLEISLKPNLSFNGKNRTTGYRSGNEFMLEYAVGQHIGPEWTIGLAGYWQKQLTDDKSNGPLNFGRSEVFGIGPSLMYFNRGMAISVKYIKESRARNRAEGDSLWVRAVIPF